jgi:hypothetical protein
MGDPLAPLPAESSQASAARIYDWALGGKDNFEIDREAGRRAEELYPGILNAARRNRAFSLRLTRYLISAGITQILDIGTGIPNSPNLHDLLWEAAPEAKIVYVDNDPTVLGYAAPFVKAAGGRAAFVEADAVESAVILQQARQHLDFTRPIALTAVAIWHFVADGYTIAGRERAYRPAEAMRELVDALPSGSLVAISHVTSDLHPDQARRLAGVYRGQGIPAQTRTRAEVEELFAGARLLDPGLVDVDQWHPELGEPSPDGGPVPVYAGVGRKD